MQPNAASLGLVFVLAFCVRSRSRGAWRFAQQVDDSFEGPTSEVVVAAMREAIRLHGIGSLVPADRFYGGPRSSPRWARSSGAARVRWRSR